jgi:hypothetical protein
MKIKTPEGLLASAAAAMLIAAFLPEPASAQPSPGTNAMYAYVGSFTTAQCKARGERHSRLPCRPGDWGISPDGRFVYGSNRGHDSITIVATNPEGLLSVVGWQPSQDSGLRFIGLDLAGRFLYAANEQGDTVVTFRVDENSGKLTPTGQAIKNASPVTIVFTGK